MPMSEDQSKQERKDLDNALRRILRTDAVCQNSELLRDNVYRVCDCFNAFYSIVKTQWDDFDGHNRKRILVKFASDRLGVERCLDRVPELGKLIHLPLEIGELIDFKTGERLDIVFDQRPTSPAPSFASTSSSDYEELSLVDSDRLDNTYTMQAVDVIKLVNSTLKPFNGEFDELNSFILNIEILESAIPAEHLLLGIKCIRGKLQGAAAGFMPASVTTYAEIISNLKLHIKAETASVVEAKLAAIRFDNNNLTKFTEEVEKAALALSKTYIHEGIPIAKANEMTIARVTETCRRSARNDLVRSVLASTHFETPKSVLSKFITEVADQNKDKQFLAFRQQQQPDRRGNNRPEGYRGGYRNYNQGYYQNGNRSHNSYTNPDYNYNRGGPNRSRGNTRFNSNYYSQNNPRNTHVRVMNEQEQESEHEQDQGN